MTIDTAQTTAWLAEDPDPATRQELTALLAEGNQAELNDRFGSALQFGTAGLRGLIGAGPNRMNRLVVARATYGVCRAVLDHAPDKAHLICIGFDGRRMSREFAADAAAIASGMGLTVHIFDEVAPTPLLAYASKELGASAGIMVTASHNPPAYNGYKVYWNNGAQIIPPTDGFIAERIARAPAYADIPQGTSNIHSIPDSLRDTYIASIKLLVGDSAITRNVSIAYTALHGVGERSLRSAMSACAFTHLESVQEQAEPDGAFPTVAFPNPEEKGAMDLVLALAARNESDLVVANDPDADRLALAVRSKDGTYVTLTGNEVGVLLAHYLLSRGPKTPKRAVLSSIVSSPMIGSIARHHEALWEPTLTGFKWIANRAIDLEQQGYTFVCGYEEALGYTVGSLVRDKDGISAAVVMSEYANACKAQGRTLLDELELAWRTYGLYLSRQVSLTLPGKEGAAKIQNVMRRLREETPKSIGGLAVTSFSDLEKQTKTNLISGEQGSTGLPPGDVLLFDLKGDHRVMARPSGTEPKIKYYFDVAVTVGSDESIAAAKQRGETLLDALTSEWARITES